MRSVRVGCLLLFVACASQPARPEAGTGTDASAGSVGLLRVADARIVDAQGAPVLLRGVAFGNEVWSNKVVPDTHHDERDFQRLAAMGVNAVRFYLNHVTFEDAAAPGTWKASGWDWLDRNVAWARRHHVFLILNLHVPPGGFQSQGEGKALWIDPALRDRFVALWTAIAARYRDEPVIAGYDLLNEPVVTSSRTQWQELAVRTLSAIRAVDPHHIVFIERTNAVGNDWSSDAELNFFLLDDPNVVYEFHFYEPFAYTHQLASWTNLGEGGPYPDETRVESAGDLKWLKIAGASSSLPAGTTPWTAFDGPKVAIDDPLAKAAKPVLVVSRLGTGGAACFDELTVWEHGPDVARALVKLDLGASQTEWYLWSENGVGEAYTIATGGRGDGKALCVRGTTGEANLGNWARRFAPRAGRTYSISGYMRGETLGATASAALRFDVETSDGPVTVRDRAFLAAALDRYVRWGRNHRVPVYLGEFGLNRPTFEMNRGGLRWVEDMLDLLAERELPFTYHSYHEDNFGIYYGYGTLPDPARANQPLIDLFTRKLAPR